MSLFKALLLSALAVIAKAAPTEVVAGRVVTHAVPSLFDSSPVFHAVRRVPAFHAAPAFHTVEAAPAVTAVRLVEQDDVEPRAQYNFGYSITDSVTGDSKTREESRDGDVVTGSYSVADPDGRIRTVTYTADDVHGFQATVTYDGEEGPVAIPFNAPSTPLVRSEPVQVAETSAEPAAVPAVKTLDNSGPAVRTVPSVQAVTVQATPTVHAVRTVPTVQAFHTTQNIQAVHNLGNAITAVRTVPAVHAVHAVQNFPAVQHFRTVQALPTTQAVHAVHNLGQAVTAVRTVPALNNFQSVNSGVRTLPAVTAIRTHPVQALNNLGAGLTAVRAFPSLQTLGRSPFLLRNSNFGRQLDLSQFHFVNSGQVV